MREYWSVGIAVDLGVERYHSSPSFPHSIIPNCLEIVRAPHGDPVAEAAKASEQLENVHHRV